MTDHVLAVIADNRPSTPTNSISDRVGAMTAGRLFDGISDALADRAAPGLAAVCRLVREVDHHGRVVARLFALASRSISAPIHSVVRPTPNRARDRCGVRGPVEVARPVVPPRVHRVDVGVLSAEQVGEAPSLDRREAIAFGLADVRGVTELAHVVDVAVLRGRC